MTKQNVMLLASAFLGLIAASCASDEPDLSTPQTPNQRPTTQQYRKTIDEALTAADRMFALIDVNAKTRSSRTVESIRVIGNQNEAKTRSGETGVDTMLYLVNYSDNQGFALLSSDWRTKPIYAIADEGCLNLSDTTFNKGLALFMENALQDFNYSVNLSADSISGIIFPPISSGGGISNPDFPEPDDYQFEVIMDVKPILGYYPSRWGQSFPFNKYVPLENGEECPVGCVAVALTHLLSVQGYPVAFEGRSFDWNAINNANCYNYYSKEMDDLAYFMASVGKSGYLNINYSPKASSAKFGKIHSVLCDLGLNSSGILKYKGSVPESAYPAAMSASRANEKDGGHAWILDGGYTYKITSNMYVDGYAWYHFEHCVWGWRGEANGYYSWSSTYGFGTQPHHYGDNDNETSNPQTGDYVKNFEYIYINK